MIKKLDMWRATAQVTDKTCHCLNAVNCPLNGNCLVEGLVYRADVESIKSQEKVYIGASEGTFKKRYYNQKLL